MWKLLKNLFHRSFAFPKTEAEIKTNVPLAKKTWMGVGGSAAYYFEPANEEDLCTLIRNCAQIPMLVLGGGSNMIIRDGGVPGLTIHLGKSFSKIT